MIAVISETGGTNLASVGFALDRIGAPWRITKDPAEIRRADRVILPGVGAANAAMTRLQDARLCQAIKDLRQPVLGICLGMQLLFKYSAEGDTPMLGLVDGEVDALPTDTQRRVPHMGWNTLAWQRPHALREGLQPTDHFYFVHSFAAPVVGETLAQTDYGTPFSAIVQRDNFVGCQFHPEKSAAAGDRFLRNFINWSAS